MRMLASSASTSVPIPAITVLIRVPIIATTVRISARRTCARPPARSVVRAHDRLLCGHRRKLAEAELHRLKGEIANADMHFET